MMGFRLTDYLQLVESSWDVALRLQKRRLVSTNGWPEYGRPKNLGFRV